MATTAVPVPDTAALLLKPGRTGARTLVVADLHLGLGASRERPTGPPEGSAPTFAASLRALAERTGARRLVVAGDVKHPIVGTPPALRPVIFDFFASLLEEGLSVEVVLGNHDVGLTRCLPREVRVHGATGAVIDGVGVFHGHAWPSDEVLRARTLAVGHLHPGYRLAPNPDDPMGKRRCWVRLELPARSRPTRSKSRRLGARELIVLPAYNPLAGTEALNRERPTRGRSFLYRRFLALGICRAYLLDGTDLGTLRMPAGPPPKRDGRRARPAA